jgi:hypothetical protein
MDKTMTGAPVDDHHSLKPAGAEFWHIWTVWIPRRSITGNSYGAAFGADTMGYVGFTSASPTMSDNNQRRLNPMPQRNRVTTVNAADARFERSAC